MNRFPRLKPLADVVAALTGQPTIAAVYDDHGPERPGPRASVNHPRLKAGNSTLPENGKCTGLRRDRHIFHSPNGAVERSPGVGAARSVRHRNAVTEARQRVLSSSARPKPPFRRRRQGRSARPPVQTPGRNVDAIEICFEYLVQGSAAFQSHLFFAFSGNLS